MSIKTIVDCNTGDVISVEMDISELPTANELKERQRKDILNQLENLDFVVPRIIEDIIEQGNFTIHQSKLDIINQKKALRLQLAELEV